MIRLEGYVPAAIAGGASAAAIGVLKYLLRHARPAAVSSDGGRIQPDRVSAWATVIVGVAMVFIGVGLILFAATGWLGVALTLMGLCIGGFMTPSLTAVHTVVWTQDGIEGPSTMFGPTLGLVRTMIPWAEIKRSGTTATGYWYIEAVDKSRVYWSYLYKGHGALSAMLRLRRPDVLLPTKMIYRSNRSLK